MNAYARAALTAAAILLAGAARAEPMTLEDAIRRSVAASPLGEASAARLEGLEAARAAAETGPSPTIDGTIENFGTPGLGQWQIDGTYNLRIERGGKREARVGLATSEMGIAEAEALIRRLDLVRDVQQLYVEAQAAQLALELARSRVEIAEVLVTEVQRRVDEARDPLFAGTRARTELAEARVDLELAEHEAEATISRLTLMTGGDPAAISIVTTGFLDLADLAPVTEDLTAAELALFEARQDRAGANFRLAEANNRTDPTVHAGPRLFGNGDVAVIAGFSLPLGNRALNRARVDQAAAEQRQVEADLAVERYIRRRDIAIVAERVEEARHEAEAIRELVIPGAEQTLREVRAGYNRGGFTFLDVSTAQTALHNARVRMVAAFTEYHREKVNLDRLTGQFTRLVGGN
ncbi:TolC family protein [Alteraurantiacibacter buctensis]|uniref:TolC family protein n=1 Tax=Alteraurantiacibacter buctensis TaxID=1503981 RepID=A0A844YTC1_9SPHN|nr:TolC family protein [Alteraurantiacibacter buctensis]MXO70266.1 TolC family protein [Alteraurantiacibacter buctensis]